MTGQTLGSVAPGQAHAFRYRLSANHAQATGYNKVPFDTKDFDTDNWFDAVTNFRFQPTVAGYYQFFASLETSQVAGDLFTSIAKNGTQYNVGSGICFNGFQAAGAMLHFLNGSSDYVEVFSYFSDAGGGTLYGAASGDWSVFSGCLIGV